MRDQWNMDYSIWMGAIERGVRDLPLDWMEELERDKYRKIQKTHYIKMGGAVDWFFEKAYQIYRNTWSDQGKVETPEFLRAVGSRGLLPLVDELRVRFPGMESLDIKDLKNALEDHIEIAAGTLGLSQNRASSEQLGKERIKQTSDELGPKRTEEVGARPEREHPKGYDRLTQKVNDLSKYIDGAKLTERQRDCFSLKYEYVLPEPQIAMRLGLKHHSTVQEHIALAKAKVDRARNKMKSSPPG